MLIFVSFSRSHSVVVGQYLGVVSGIYWLRLVASRIVDSFLSYASRISELSPYGAKQLASDTRLYLFIHLFLIQVLFPAFIEHGIISIGYLQTMLEALQHTGASTLGAFREIVLTDISSIASSPQYVVCWLIFLSQLLLNSCISMIVLYFFLVGEQNGYSRPSNRECNCRGEEKIPCSKDPFIIFRTIFIFWKVRIEGSVVGVGYCPWQCSSNLVFLFNEIVDLVVLDYRI